MRRIVPSLGLAICVLIAAPLAALAQSPSPVALAAPSAATAAATVFDTPTELAEGDFSWGVSAAIDADGVTHIAAAGWHGGKGGLWYATDRDGDWTFERVLDWSSGSVWTDPSLAIDSDGRVVIAVARTSCAACASPVAKGIYLISDRSHSRGTFADSPTLATGTGTAQPSLAIRGTHLYLAYAGDPVEDPAAVLLRTNVTGAWTVRTVAAHGTNPSIAFGDDGYPRIAYEGADRLVYVRATTSTGTFKADAVTDTYRFDGSPDLAIDPDGQVRLAWLDDGPTTTQVAYAERTTDGWTASVDAGAGDQAAIAMASGVPWIALGGDAVRVVRADDPALTPVMVSADASAALDLAADASTITVAWAVADEGGLWVASAPAAGVTPAS